MNLSIVIPCYNLGSYINKCIESLEKQNYQDVEFIFVNDGSTDNTLSKIQIFAKKDSRVIIIDKINEGVSAARNDALKISRGKYVLFLDGDDFLDVDTCYNMCQEIKKDSPDILIFQYNIYKNNVVYSHYNHKISVGLYSLKEFLMTINSFPVSYKLYKRDIIVNNNISFNTNLKYGEVFEFFLNYLFFCNKIAVTNNSYYNYVLRPNSAIHSLNFEKELSIIDSVSQMNVSVERLNSVYNNSLAFHRAVFHLVRVLILVKYISLGLTYEIVKDCYTSIYTNSLIKHSILYIVKKDKSSFQNRLLAFLLTMPSRISYNTILFMYKIKKFINR